MELDQIVILEKLFWKETFCSDFVEAAFGEISRLLQHSCLLTSLSFPLLLSSVHTRNSTLLLALAEYSITLTTTTTTTRS